MILSAFVVQPSRFWQDFALPFRADVRRAEASTRTSEYARLVAQGKMLEEEVSTRGQN
jgi:hypothetical protein